MERPSPERSIIHIGCIEYRVYVAQALLLPLPGRPSHAKSSCGCAAPATNEIPVEPCISPSPGTPGEGRGEGLFLVHGRALTLTLPEYREREPEDFQDDAQQISDERRCSFSSARVTPLGSHQSDLELCRQYFARCSLRHKARRRRRPAVPRFVACPAGAPRFLR